MGLLWYTWLVIIIISFNILKFSLQADPLWCYSCGGGQHEIDCTIFMESAHWDPFTRDCGGDALCVKTVTHDKIESRGCTPTKTFSGTPHHMGCFGHDTTGMLFCFCNSSYCNGQPSRYHLQSSGFLFLSIPLFVTFSSL